MFLPCAVIPVYEHAAPLAKVLAGLQACGLTAIVIDDGSGEECQRALRNLADTYGPKVRLGRLEKNAGKGAAMKVGFERAFREGFTHALQVDADGQHDLGAVPALLAAAEREPAAAVCARPTFDSSAPGARLHGRKLTNFWVAVNTLSRDIPDAMCGFRVYPLEATLKVVGASGDRMDFDPDILVRLHWAGVPMRFLPVKVNYPEGGTSHFRMGRDNVLISWMHARLFFGMLLRSARLLLRRRA